MSYVEKSKQVGSISESPLKTIIDEKSAKGKDHYGESLRKISLEEKSENIRKTFSESPNRIDFQQLSEDNIRKPSRDLTTKQSFDETVTRINYTDHGERPVKKNKDPLSTRPSISLSEKVERTSLDDGSKESLLFDRTSRLSLSPKSASRIKDYARDVQAKSRKVRQQRFSIPFATVIEPAGSNRILQPTESILKSKDTATSSPSVREPAGNNSLSQSLSLNIDKGAALPTAGAQDNEGVEPATVPHMNEVEESFGKIFICTKDLQFALVVFRTSDVLSRGAKLVLPDPYLSSSFQRYAMPVQ